MTDVYTFHIILQATPAKEGGEGEKVTELSETRKIEKFEKDGWVLESRCRTKRGRKKRMLYSENMEGKNNEPLPSCTGRERILCLNWKF